MTVVTTTVRAAKARDASALCEIHSSAWHHSYDGLIPHDVLRAMIARRPPQWWADAVLRGTGLLVLDFGGEPVGYASYGRNRAPTLPCGGEVYELYLRPEYQGTGMGRRLFAEARTRLREQCRNGIVVWALKDNHNACAIYEHWGGTASAEGSERFGRVTLHKVAFLWT